MCSTHSTQFDNMKGSIYLLNLCISCSSNFHEGSRGPEFSPNYDILYANDNIITPLPHIASLLIPSLEPDEDQLVCKMSTTSKSASSAISVSALFNSPMHSSDEMCHHQRTCHRNLLWM